MRRGKLEAGDGFSKCIGRVSFHCPRVMGNRKELLSYEDFDHGSTSRKDAQEQLWKVGKVGFTLLTTYRIQGQRTRQQAEV